jgi:hypothetical protein
LDEKDFAEWVNNLGFKPVPYVGGTGPRHEIQPNVGDGAHEENVFTIELHNEMAYSARHPKVFSIKYIFSYGSIIYCENDALMKTF